MKVYVLFIAFSHRERSILYNISQKYVTLYDVMFFWTFLVEWYK